MDTFIRMAEVWVPSEDGTLLEPAGGLYDAAPGFGAATRDLCFGRREGLPGHVWDEARPVLLAPLEGSYFRRVVAARAAGVGCAIGWPVYAGARLSSVVVLLCGDAAHHGGAIELWQNDPRVTGDLRLDSGYFGAGAGALEDLARDAWLPRGSGAPGLAWQRDGAVFIDAVESAPQFLRAQTAASAGVVRALALPCPSRDGRSWIINLLSAQRTPIARRIESWLVADGGARVVRAFGFCESLGRLPDPATPMDADAMGAIGRAVARATAQVGSGDGLLHGALGDSEAARAGLSAVLAVPLGGAEGEGPGEVIALYL